MAQTTAEETVTLNLAGCQVVAAAAKIHILAVVARAFVTVRHFDLTDQLNELGAQAVAAHLIEDL